MKQNKKIFSLFALILLCASLNAGERQTIWPKGKMPHRQDHQIAAMTDEAGQKTFNPDKHPALPIVLKCSISGNSCRREQPI